MRIDAREAVLRRLEKMHDDHATTEQLMIAVGEYERSQEAGERAQIVERAMEVELKDPEPRPTCGCVQCGLYRVGVRRVT